MMPALNLYGPNEIDDILDAGKLQLGKKRKAEFVVRLEVSAADYVGEALLQKKGPPYAIAKQLATVRRQAAGLFKMLTESDGPVLQGRLHKVARRYPDIDASVENAIWHLKVIERFADDAEKIERSKVEPGKARHHGDKAFHKFFKKLIDLWRDMSGCSPGASVNPRSDGEPSGGPFVRFVLACHEPLWERWPEIRQRELTPHAVRGMYQRRHA